MNKIEIRKGIQLRKIGNRYMIVDACAGNVNMSKVYSLNQTAAWIWQCVADGCTTLDELTERFVRGDVARTTEGSGLGLSIARSLTQLQKGEFVITIDGDLFKAVVTFPREQTELVQA